MREIKFRAWDTKKEKMISSDELMADYRYFDLMIFAANGYRTRAMQYTGLNDKHGVEIYEGDVCLLTNTYLGMSQKSTIEIAYVDWGFVGRWPESESPTGYMYNPLCAYNFPVVLIEVIGNIYENPELIPGVQHDI